MRIGEILGLRWKRVDLLRGTIEVAESSSDGEFGSPKTRSSNRVIPVSGYLRSVLEAHRASQTAIRLKTWSSRREQERRSVQKTYTTACSRPPVIGPNNHACRGIRSGTLMRHCSRMWGSRSRPHSPCWAIRILGRRSIPMHMRYRARNVALSSEWPEFCSQMYSSWTTAQKKQGSTDCDYKT